MDRANPILKSRGWKRYSGSFDMTVPPRCFPRSPATGGGNSFRGGWDCFLLWPTAAAVAAIAVLIFLVPARNQLTTLTELKADMQKGDVADGPPYLRRGSRQDGVGRPRRLQGRGQRQAGGGAGADDGAGRAAPPHLQPAARGISLQRRMSEPFPHGRRTEAHPDPAGGGRRGVVVGTHRLVDADVPSRISDWW